MTVRLAEHLDRLETWLRRDPTAPSWQRVRIVEGKEVRWSTVSIIPRSACSSVAEYDARFDARLESGYDWINLSALGIVDDELLVSIELPRTIIGVRGRTSVNIPGPTLWDVNARFKIE